MSRKSNEIEARFLELLRRAFEGWQAKVARDFSKESFDAELASLASDDLYRSFGLAVPEYVLIRLMGRVSISVGRRLGELYDNLPKFVAAARFNLSTDQVAARIAGLNLDVCIPFAHLQPGQIDSVVQAVSSALAVDVKKKAGLGIEIRYNFNPNDSARLRKDVAMANGLVAANLLPIYLVYSGISPRDEAIKRLKIAGWHFLVAKEASDFTVALLGLDLAALLAEPSVQDAISSGVNTMMLTLVNSAAFAAAVASAEERRGV